MYPNTGTDQGKLDESQLPAHQAEAMALLHTTRSRQSISHTQTHDNGANVAIEHKNTSPSILKDNRNNSGNSSQVRYFNISDELCNAMEESRIEGCLDISEQDLATYDNEIALTFISILVYRKHTQNPCCSASTLEHLSLALAARH